MVSSTQVMNAQDANAPLRDVGKKDEEREEEGEEARNGRNDEVSNGTRGSRGPGSLN